MHNRALHDALAAFVAEAAWQLAEEVSGGAEIPYELESFPPARDASPLYCYRPQTDRFIAAHVGVLGRLPSYPAAAQGLAALPDLSAYLQASGRRPASGDPRAQADAALQALLTAVWADTADFSFDPERFAAAYGDLEEAAYSGCSLAVVLTPVEGLVCESEEVVLGDGLALVRAGSLEDAPADLRGDAYATVAALRLEGAPGEDAGLETAGRRLRRLQTALRLWDDAEPALGPAAWARTGDGPWLAIPLATGLRRTFGDCLLSAEEEDPLRAFCSLIARRTPRGGELAWALRRFELGCDRASPLEALTDWLLAMRALMGDQGSGGLERGCHRLAAICANPEDREPLVRRVREVAALERRVVSGTVQPDPAVEELVAELGGLLRAVLRDVLCGHLDPDLRGLADELILDAAAPPEPAVG
jgi:hypothetical protein